MPVEGGRFSGRAFWKAIEVFAVVSLLLTLVAMFIQVTARYVIGIAVPWTDEASRFLFIASIFSGAVICQRRGTHIRITVLLDVLPARARWWLEIASDIFAALVTAAVIVGTVEMAHTTADLSAVALPITYAWLYTVQGLSCCLIFLLFLRDAWLKIAEKGPSA